MHACAGGLHNTPQPATIIPHSPHFCHAIQGNQKLGEHSIAPRLCPPLPALTTTITTMVKKTMVRGRPQRITQRSCTVSSGTSVVPPIDRVGADHALPGRAARSRGMPRQVPTTTMTTTKTRGRTRRRWKDNNNNKDNDAEGGDCSNGTVVRRRYGQPCNQHPARRPGVVHVKASTGICAGV
jgi:hypothetical protein